MIVIRDLAAADRDECLDLLRNRPFFGRVFEERGFLQLLFEHWDRMLRHPSLSGTVGEDLSQPSGARIVVCGLLGFVRDTFLDQYLLNPFPPLGAAAFQDLARGQHNALLTPGELRQANTHEGLISVVLWTNVRRDLVFSNPAGHRACVQALLRAAQGYRVRRFLTEYSDLAEQREFSSAELNRVLVQYRDRWPDFDWRENEHPQLCSLTRDDLSIITNVLAPIFNRPAIRFALHPSQQELIRLALRHPSDAELLEALGHSIGLNALGRRWDRIYKRIEALQPPDHPVLPKGCTHAQKRVRTLLYFADHYHELRPHAISIPLR